MDILFNKINQPQTNREYPYALFGASAGETTYQDYHAMKVGEKKVCQYDWNYIEEKIVSSHGEKSNFSLLHTHPKPDGDEFEGTLFSKYSNELSEIGIKPQGLNISIADVYVNQYVENLAKKLGKDLNIESTILMHDGSLISFSTSNGLALNNHIQLQRNKNIQHIKDPSLQSGA